MNFKTLIYSLLITLFLLTGCDNAKKDDPARVIDIEAEKAAILATINNETKAAFTRDYEGWKDKWVHDPFVTKTYINFADSSSSESLGWQAIDDFVRTYIEEHPEPDPIPTLVDEIEVRIYGSGAWVSFEQADGDRGVKRETRLMEKVDGQWKIAGMHTTIYGEKID